MRRILLVASLLTGLAAATHAIAANKPSGPGVRVRVGPDQTYPYPVRVKPQVDTRYLPVGCNGRLETNLFEEGPVRMGCGPKWGRLAPEKVQAVMRKASFDACWTDDATTGSVRFIIGRDGTTGHVTATAGDAGACIEREVSGLTFPIPKDGPVMVTFPLRRQTDGV